MRRSCNALTTMLACLACTVWAVGPSHSEAKAKHGWAGPIDCGYQPEFHSLDFDPANGADEWSGAQGCHRSESELASHQAEPAAAPVAELSRPSSLIAHPVAGSSATPPAWFGCGGLPGWPCGNFLAMRSPEASAPYTYSPYWSVTARKAASAARTANPVWFSVATGYDVAFDAAIAGKAPSVAIANAPKCIKSEPSARAHWDTLDDYCLCPLAQEEAPATASMASLEGHRVSACEAEYNYMSAHDAAFGNAWPTETFPQAKEQDYRPWNCDAAIAGNARATVREVASESFRQVVDYSSHATQWLALAAARTLEHYSAMLSDLSLTMETAVRSAFENAERTTPELYDDCWE